MSAQDIISKQTLQKSRLLEINSTGEREETVCGLTIKGVSVCVSFCLSLCVWVCVCVCVCAHVGLGYLVKSTDTYTCPDTLLPPREATCAEHRRVWHG